MKALDEGVLSWAYFRVLESLNQDPPDVDGARSYALDGVKYLIEDLMPEKT